MAEPQAEQTLRAIISLARFGEVFAYDEHSRRCSTSTIRNSAKPCNGSRQGKRIMLNVTLAHTALYLLLAPSLAGLASASSGSGGSAWLASGPTRWWRSGLLPLSSLPASRRAMPAPHALRRRWCPASAFSAPGSIFKEGLNVRGLNTAATLWCSSAVGVLSGAGFLAHAVLATVLIIGINLLLRPAMTWINQKLPAAPAEVGSGLRRQRGLPGRG